MQQYEEAEGELDLYWRQQTRVQWTQLGDRNTAFFHAVATQRRQTNNITSVDDQHRTRLTQEN
jgi:hypothetical protein